MKSETSLLSFGTTWRQLRGALVSRLCLAICIPPLVATYMREDCGYPCTSNKIGWSLPRSEL